MAARRESPHSPPPPVPFALALRVWARVAVLSFGGPAGQIAVMHRILVEEKRWVSESRFLHALNYCMLLPGPEAQQLATYIGWLLHRTPGGLVAGGLFVLPGFVSILALSLVYVSYGETTIVAALFFGLRAAVLAVVVEAVVRVGRRVLANGVMVAISALAFVAIFFLQVPFPLIVLGAGMIGLIGGRLRPETFFVLAPRRAEAGEASAAAELDGLDARQSRPTLARALGVLAVWGTVWFLPLVGLGLWLGRGHVLVTEGIFFSQAAVVTFGGAYSVLAYVAQQAVETYGWLRPGEMLTGLAMAETTPGPLIQVVQFVGFLGAYRHPEPFSPLGAALLGSLVTTWVTYTPCFLWIFLGAPYVERLRGNVLLSSALSSITAAVVGVILNLAVWFAVHVVFGRVAEVERFGVRLLSPDWSTASWESIALAAAAFVTTFRLHWGMGATLAFCAGAGLLLRLVAGTP